MTTRKAADAFATNKKNTFSHGISFGSHPVSCAVALRNIEIIESEGLVEHSARTGGHLMSQLKEMQSRHRLVGDVRGIGMMLMVELVKNQETQEQLGPDDDMQSTTIGLNATLRACLDTLLRPTAFKT